MKTIIITALLLTTLAANGTDRQRAELLLSIQDDHVSIFINRIFDDAKTVCDSTGLPIGLLIAQACLESGYGRSYNATHRNNLLGIRINHAYVVYKSHLDCFYHWSRVLCQSCYKKLEPDSLNIWLYLLDTCHYHLSKTYSKKIRWIYKKYNLGILDNFKH